MRRKTTKVGRKVRFQETLLKDLVKKLNVE